MQITGDASMSSLTAQGSYLARFSLGLFAAFGLVFPATVAVGGRGHDLLSLSVGAGVTLALAVAASAISAWLVRHKSISLVLLAQGFTVLAIGALNFLVF